MHAYMAAFGLNFGCFDFIVPKGGAPIFLEMNCNGQWLWVQDRIGQNIGEAIARLLIKHSAVAGDHPAYFQTDYGGTLRRERRLSYADVTGPRLSIEDFTVACGATGQVYEGDQCKSAS